MDKIDKILRDSLSNEQMEYKEEYWSEFEKKLDSQPTNATKTGIHWVYYLSLAVVLGTVLLLSQKNGFKSIFNNSNEVTIIEHQDTDPDKSTNLEKNKLKTDLKNKNIKQQRSDYLEKANISNHLNQAKVNSKNKSNRVSKNNGHDAANISHSSLPKREFSHNNLGNLLFNDNVQEAFSNNDLKSHSNFVSNPIENIDSNLLVTGFIKTFEINAKDLLLEPEVILTNKNMNQENRIQIYTPKPKFHIQVFTRFGNYSKQYDLQESALKNREKPQNIFSYGLNIIYGKRFGIKSGIGITKINETTNFYNIHYQFETKEYYNLVDRDYTTTSSGRTIARIEKVIDTVSTIEIQNPICENCLSTFTYLSVPLAFQYNKRLTSRFSTQAEIGIISHFVLNEKGYYSERDGLINLSKKQKLSSPIHLQYTAAFGFSYNINSKISAYSSFSYFSSLNSMIKSYNQKLNSAGIELGLNISLGAKPVLKFKG